MLRVGLNPYGIAFSMGLWGAKTPRQNPNPLGLWGYLKVAEDSGVRCIEIPEDMLLSLDAKRVSELQARLKNNQWPAVVSSHLLSTSGDKITEAARRANSKTIRLGLTNILCGARGTLGLGAFKELFETTLTRLKHLAHSAEGLTLAIENHQDFGSAELMEFCEGAGPNVGVCMDCGNALAVGEDPVEFARTVAPRIRHVHLKDYRAQFTDEGYRLIRCAIGDGAVRFAEVAKALHEGSGGRELTSSLEPGALEARHIQLFTPGWWVGYPPREASHLARGLAAARVKRLIESEDWRTPWEKEEGPEAIVAYERAQLEKSIQNMQALGWL